MFLTYKPTVALKVFIERDSETNKRYTFDKKGNPHSVPDSFGNYLLDERPDLFSLYDSKKHVEQNEGDRDVIESLKEQVEKLEIEKAELQAQLIELQKRITPPKDQKSVRRRNMKGNAIDGDN